MADERLMLSQRNRVLEAIQAAGVVPRLFAWTERESQYTPNTIVSVLRCEARPRYYFAFEVEGIGRVTEFSPAEAGPLYRGAGGSFDMQLRDVAIWLRYLRREIEAPDLWGEIHRERQFLEDLARPDPDNRPFAPDEWRAIGERLARIEADFFAHHQLSREQAGFVMSEFARLVDSTHRFGRKDWLVFAMGTCVNIALYLAQAGIGPWLLKAIMGLWNTLHGGGPALPP